MLAERLYGRLDGCRPSGLLSRVLRFDFRAQLANFHAHVDSLFPDAVKAGGVATGFGHDDSFSAACMRLPWWVAPGREGKARSLGTHAGKSRRDLSEKSPQKHQRAGTFQYRRAFEMVDFRLG